MLTQCALPPDGQFTIWGQTFADNFVLVRRMFTNSASKWLQADEDENKYFVGFTLSD